MKDITKEYTKLTKHSTGSIKELFTISFPLMLSFLSTYLMIFVDRLILSRYSLEALNAATTASLFVMIFQIGATDITTIAEVFVGQYNGSKQYKKAPAAVWQMIWFSIFLIPIFFLLSQFAGPLLLPKYYYTEFGLPYFQWLLYFTVFFAIQGAISSFFIGIGKTKLIITATILANIVNIVLDIILIFGVKGYIPALAAKGAAIATGIAQVFQVWILLVFFFSFKNREKYNTAHFFFDFKLIKKCLKVGFPSAIGHMIEIAAWAIMLRLLANMGSDYLTVMVIGQNIFAAIAFFTSGLQKGVSTVSANLIGAKNYIKIAKTYTSAVKLLLLIATIISTILIFYPNFLINAFLKDVTSDINIKSLFNILKISCVYLWGYFLLDGFTWVTAGILTAAGDTIFIMIMNAIGAWFFALVPFYFLIIKLGFSPKYIWLVMDFYAFMNAVSFYIRYKIGPWMKNNKILR